MAANGSTSPGLLSSPPLDSKPPPLGVSGNHRQSAEGEQSNGASSPPVLHNGINGHSMGNGIDSSDDPEDRVSKLQGELERTRQEKENLAAQYQTLLARLTQMRTTLGNKLKQDAEELDRREQLVQQLTAQNEDLHSTLETLKEELISSNREAEQASHELDIMRSRTMQENAQESLMRDRELREAQTELEQCRMEREEWEQVALQERAIVDDRTSTLEALHRDLGLEREARAREAAELESEKLNSSNLQSVLQDFQAAKDHELRQAVKDYESQLTRVTQSLAEFKHRALTAEVQLEESHTNITRTQELEKELKEKNLLTGKLRHEAVIINEHLMEALRRLRRNSSDTNVDRRLVTNVILSFLTTPRADPKRFEMLSLLSSILSWTDQEREKAGLQRSGASAVPSTFWGRSSSSSGPPTKAPDLDKSDETESFSRLWVEFLLTEAGAGETPSTPVRNNSSLPGSPTVNTHPLSPTRAPPRRLASLSSAMASSPNLTLQPAPSRKGKEKEWAPET